MHLWPRPRRALNDSPTAFRLDASAGLGVGLTVASVLGLLHAAAWAERGWVTSMTSWFTVLSLGALLATPVALPMAAAAACWWPIEEQVRTGGWTGWRIAGGRGVALLGKTVRAGLIAGLAAFVIESFVAPQVLLLMRPDARAAWSAAGDHGQPVRWGPWSLASTPEYTVFTSPSGVGAARSVRLEGEDVAFVGGTFVPERRGATIRFGVWRPRAARNRQVDLTERTLPSLWGRIERTRASGGDARREIAVLVKRLAFPVAVAAWPSLFLPAAARRHARDALVLSAVGYLGLVRLGDLGVDVLGPFSALIAPCTLGLAGLAMWWTWDDR